LGRPFEHCGNLLGGAREEDGIGGAVEGGRAIVSVGVEILRVCQDIIVWQDFVECEEMVFGKRHDERLWVEANAARGMVDA
jgi:hypothetical protein